MELKFAFSYTSYLGYASANYWVTYQPSLGSFPKVRHLDNPFSIARFVLCVKQNWTDLISWEYLKPHYSTFLDGEDAVGNLKVQNKKL